VPEAPPVPSCRALTATNARQLERISRNLQNNNIMKNSTKITLTLFLMIFLTACTQVKTTPEHNTATQDITEYDTVIHLPAPQLDGTISVEKALYDRRSQRRFQDKEISLENLSQILWAAYGITLPLENPAFLRGGLRTAPSAGALYPLEIYVAVGKVTGVEPGVYRYIADGHKMVKIIDEDLREELTSAAWGQKMVEEAPASVIYTAIFSRMTNKYGERGRERYVCMDLGHSAQNVYLQAEALGLGTCAIGAFTDAQVAKLLNLPKEEEPLYIMPIGYYDR